MKTGFQCIDVSEAAALIQREPVTVVDIRDPQSFAQGHIAGAIRLDNSNVDSFLAEADKSLPVLVYCYHGNSSVAAADFFARQGFERVYSLNGGMSQWQLTQPVEKGQM